MSVYTSLSADDIHALLQTYELGTLVKFEGISAGIENTNYFVHTNQLDENGNARKLILTLFETTSITDLPVYFELMACLAAYGLPSARPFKKTTGDYLSILKGKPAVLIECLPGQSVDKPNVDHCAAVGRFLAEMHLYSQRNRFPLENYRGFKWRHEVIAKLSSLDRQQSSWLNEEHEKVCLFEQLALPQGAIHGDLFHDNALFVGHKLTGVIDFYYASNAAYIYDLAVVFADWCFIQNDNQLDMDNAKALIQGYHAVREISAEESRAWSQALMAVSLRFYLSRLHDKHFPREGAMTQEKNPDSFLALLDDSRKNQDRYMSIFT